VVNAWSANSFGESHLRGTLAPLRKPTRLAMLAAVLSRPAPSSAVASCSWAAPTPSARAASARRLPRRAFRSASAALLVRSDARCGRVVAGAIFAGPEPTEVARTLPSERVLVASLEAITAPVREDMTVMNANLMSIVGERHPMLKAAAKQIFGAGGKKLRPVLCFLVARATAQACGLRCAGGVPGGCARVRVAASDTSPVSGGPRSELTPQHRRLAEITEMIHTASLVHDDVLDDCSLRRGAGPGSLQPRPPSLPKRRGLPACTRSSRPHAPRARL